MVIGCGAKVLKYCLFAFNLVFFVAGVVCLGLGIYLMADKHAIDRMVIAAEEQGYKLQNKTAIVYTLGVTMAVGGAVILIIAFLGCCGAVKEWRPLLVLYAICLMIILAVEVAISIYAGMNKNNLEIVAKKVMIESIKAYGGTSERKSAVRTVWDGIMTEHQCCGINSSSENEFLQSDWYKKNFTVRYKGDQDKTEYYPAQCCNKVDWIKIPTAGTQDDPVCKNRFFEGCYLKLREGIASKLAIVVGVGIAIAFIQLIGIMFSLCLCRAISDENFD